MTNKFIEQRVEALENELSELKLIVAQIRKPSPLVSEELIQAPTPESIAEWDNKPKTANQLRAEIIEKAKGFVETKTHYLRDSSVVKGGGAAKRHENPKFSSWVTKAEFIVNTDKRTVVAIIRNMYGDKIRAKGIAKCDPSDVFNEHIGKAIALGRALGLDVSEFEQAVQPTLAVGQIVYFTNSHGSNIHYRIDSKEIIDDEPNLTIVKDYGRTTNGTRSFATFGGNPDVKVVIINDTNAQYGGAE